jgi:hypothetical protein
VLAVVVAIERTTVVLITAPAGATVVATEVLIAPFLVGEIDRRSLLGRGGGDKCHGNGEDGED